jgi:hypothetical protein
VWLTIDPTGAHALLGVQQLPADDNHTLQVYRSDGGDGPRLVPAGDVVQADW